LNWKTSEIWRRKRAKTIRLEFFAAISRHGLRANREVFSFSTPFARLARP
jgi:hypothetical protein